MRPHVPGHGSTHLLRKQARSRWQSELSTHSGRQPIKGLPLYSGIQEHCPFLQIVFGPQGDGTQGSMGSVGSEIGMKKVQRGI